MQRIHTEDGAIESEIQAKGKTAPRITPADIEANVTSEVYFTAEDGFAGAEEAGNGHVQKFGDTAPAHSLRLLTFCVLVLKNGFTVTGESACASRENFDAEIGRKIARQNAVQKIWPLLGFALKQDMYEQAMKPTRHQQRVIDEKRDIDEKAIRLDDSFYSPIFAKLPPDEQVRLRTQHLAMKTYSDILAERIAAF